MATILEYAAYYGLFVSLVYLVGIALGGDLVIEWYDAWVGLFIDRPKRRWYLFLIPCIGLKYPGWLKQLANMQHEERAAMKQREETLQQYMDRVYAEKETLFEGFTTERTD